MMTPDTSLYTDLASFTSLRAQAQSNPNEAIDQVAAQFESIFVQMMMKSMRDASEPLESGLMASNQMESYEQMFDQQLSLDLSSGGGLGLAGIIAAQLGGTNSVSEGRDKMTENKSPADIASYWLGAQTAKSHSILTPDIEPSESVETQPIVAIKESSGNESARSKLTTMFETIKENIKETIEETIESDDKFDWLPESPKQFIQDLGRFAEQAAEKLGVNPKVILAQAALESGWGKHVIQNFDGSSSFNLFGIKAGSDWQGSTATVQTLEYENGIAEKQTASFRSYASLADAFEDYVNFLTQSPRYEQALEQAADEQQYVRGLQEGGYATDPKYAEKILSILSRDEFAQSTADSENSDLKSSNRMPLL